MRFVLLFLFFSGSLQILAQSPRGEWHVTLGNPAASLNEENELIISVNLPEGWGIYSTNFASSSFGPEPTVFEFNSSPNYLLQGKIRAIDPIAVDYEMLSISYAYFESKAEFRQRIHLLDYPAKLNGKISGYLINLKSGKKEPFEESFNFSFDTATASR